MTKNDFVKNILNIALNHKNEKSNFQQYGRFVFTVSSRISARVRRFLLFLKHKYLVTFII